MAQSSAAAQATLRYLGHCAYQWISPADVRVLIDPYDNAQGWDWFLRPFPAVDTDIVLITHRHFDHDAAHRLPGAPTALRGPGEFRHGDLLIRGILDRHANRSGRTDIPNVIFVVEIGGVCFCHLGDNRADLPQEVKQSIGAVDVLMVPVDDSCHILLYREVDALVATLGPKVVVPMHYLIPGLTDPRSTLESPAGWLKGQSLLRRRGHHSLRIGARDMPRDREVWVLAPWLPEPEA